MTSRIPTPAEMNEKAREFWAVPFNQAQSNLFQQHFDTGWAIEDLVTKVLNDATPLKIEQGLRENGNDASADELVKWMRKLIRATERIHKSQSATFDLINALQQHVHNGAKLDKLVETKAKLLASEKAVEKAKRRWEKDPIKVVRDAAKKQFSERVRWTAPQFHTALSNKGHSIPFDTARKWLTALRKTGTC